MPGRWIEVVRVAFKGGRFRDHALDLSALSELTRFQKIVTETAKALYLDAHPSRQRVPKGFEEQTRLCLRRIEDGSAVAPLEVRVDEGLDKLPLQVDPEPIKRAVELTHEVLGAAEQNAPLPERFPRELLPEYAAWGQTLLDDEEIELILPGRRPARMNQRARATLERLQELPHQSHTELVGKVLEADVRQRRFQLWIDETTAVVASFSPEQEDRVTEALRRHREIQLTVRGMAEFSPVGQPERFLQVDELEIVEPEPVYDTTARPIEEELAELARQVPPEDWAKLPTDLADNIDHYAYGTPKT